MITGNKVGVSDTGHPQTVYTSDKITYYNAQGQVVGQLSSKPGETSMPGVQPPDRQQTVTQTQPTAAPNPNAVVADGGAIPSGAQSPPPITGSYQADYAIGQMQAFARERNKYNVLYAPGLVARAPGLDQPSLREMTWKAKQEAVRTGSNVVLDYQPGIGDQPYQWVMFRTGTTTTGVPTYNKTGGVDLNYSLASGTQAPFPNPFLGVTYIGEHASAGASYTTTTTGQAVGSTSNTKGQNYANPPPRLTPIGTSGGSGSYKDFYVRAFDTKPTAPEFVGPPAPSQSVKEFGGKVLKQSLVPMREDQALAEWRANLLPEQVLTTASGEKLAKIGPDKYADMGGFTYTAKDVTPQFSTGIKQADEMRAALMPYVGTKQYELQPDVITQGDYWNYRSGIKTPVGEWVTGMQTRDKQMREFLAQDKKMQDWASSEGMQVSYSPIQGISMPAQGPYGGIASGEVLYAEKPIIPYSKLILPFANMKEDTSKTTVIAPYKFTQGPDYESKQYEKLINQRTDIILSPFIQTKPLTSEQKVISLLLHRPFIPDKAFENLPANADLTKGPARDLVYGTQKVGFDILRNAKENVAPAREISDKAIAEASFIKPARFRWVPTSAEEAASNKEYLTRGIGRDILGVTSATWEGIATTGEFAGKTLGVFLRDIPMAASQQEASKVSLMNRDIIGSAGHQASKLGSLVEPSMYIISYTGIPGLARVGTTANVVEKITTKTPALTLGGLSSAAGSLTFTGGLIAAPAAIGIYEKSEKTPEGLPIITEKSFWQGAGYGYGMVAGYSSVGFTMKNIGSVLPWKETSVLQYELRGYPKPTESRIVSGKYETYTEAQRKVAEEYLAHTKGASSQYGPGTNMLTQEQLSSKYGYDVSSSEYASYTSDYARIEKQLAGNKYAPGFEYKLSTKNLETPPYGIETPFAKQQETFLVKSVQEPSWVGKNLFNLKTVEYESRITKVAMETGTYENLMKGVAGQGTIEDTNIKPESWDITDMFTKNIEKSTQAYDTVYLTKGARYDTTNPFSATYTYRQGYKLKDVRIKPSGKEYVVAPKDKVSYTPSLKEDFKIGEGNIEVNGKLERIQTGLGDIRSTDYLIGPGKYIKIMRNGESSTVISEPDFAYTGYGPSNIESYGMSKNIVRVGDVYPDAQYLIKATPYKTVSVQNKIGEFTRPSTAAPFSILMYPTTVKPTGIVPFSKVTTKLPVEEYTEINPKDYFRGISKEMPSVPKITEYHLNLEQQFTGERDFAFKMATSDNTVSGIRGYTYTRWDIPMATTRTAQITKYGLASSEMKYVSPTTSVNPPTILPYVSDASIGRGIFTVGGIKPMLIKDYVTAETPRPERIMSESTFDTSVKSIGKSPGAYMKSIQQEYTITRSSGITESVELPLHTRATSMTITKPELTKISVPSVAEAQKYKLGYGYGETMSEPKLSFRQSIPDRTKISPIRITAPKFNEEEKLVVTQTKINVPLQPETKYDVETKLKYKFIETQITETKIPPYEEVKLPGPEIIKIPPPPIEEIKIPFVPPAWGYNLTEGLPNKKRPTRWVKPRQPLPSLFGIAFPGKYKTPTILKGTSLDVRANAPGPFGTVGKTGGYAAALRQATKITRRKK